MKHFVARYILKVKILRVLTVKLDFDAQECIKVAIFWQDWAPKVCRFSVLFGYLTK